MVHPEFQHLGRFGGQRQRDERGESKSKWFSVILVRASKGEKGRTGKKRTTMPSHGLGCLGLRARSGSKPWQTRGRPFCLWPNVCERIAKVIVPRLGSGL